jgi:hypothetical protein
MSISSEEHLMPTNKQKPSKSAKPAPGKKPGRELSDDDLRTISGGMISSPTGSAKDPVCVSSTGG